MTTFKKIRKRTNFRPKEKDDRPIELAYSWLEEIYKKIASSGVPFCQISKDSAAVGFERTDFCWYSPKGIQHREKVWEEKESGKIHRVEGYKFLVNPLFFPSSIEQYFPQSIDAPLTSRLQVYNPTKENHELVCSSFSLRLEKEIIEKPVPKEYFENRVFEQDLSKVRLYSPELFEREEIYTVFPFHDYDTDCGQVHFVCVKPNDIVYPLDHDHLVGLYQSFRIIISMIGGNEERNKYIDFFDTKGLQFSKKYADEKDW